MIKIKKPAAVILEFTGIVAEENFVEKYLMPYFKKDYKKYLETKWSKDECKEDVKALILAAASNQNAPKIDDKATKSEQIEALAKYIMYCEKSDKDSKAFATFRYHVWFFGYERGYLKTLVCLEVAEYILKLFDDKTKLYILTDDLAEHTKKFMSQTSLGNLNMLTEDYLDASLGSLTDTETYKKMATDKVKKEPTDIVLLTKSPKLSKVAKEAGLNVVMLTSQSDPSTEVACKDIATIRSCKQIEFV